MFEQRSVDALRKNRKGVRMDSNDVFTTETAGLPEASRPDVVRLYDGDHYDLRIPCASASATPRSACSGTTARFLAPRCTSIKDRRSPWRQPTTATWKRPSIGTASGYKTVTTVYRKRHRPRSGAERRTPTSSSSPTPGSTGTTPTSGKTS